MTLADELAALYRKSGFGEVVGARPRSVRAYTSCLLVPMSNIEARRRYLKYHDLHHLVTAAASAGSARAKSAPGNSVAAASLMIHAAIAAPAAIVRIVTPRAWLQLLRGDQACEARRFTLAVTRGSPSCA